MPETIIYHIDVNSAFLSWEACRRISTNSNEPDLRDIPSVVGGSQEMRHGIVLAKSLPAKKFGIQTGEPLVKAKQQCPHLVVVPPDYELYVECSRKLIELLKTISPTVEQYSIDEAFVDMTGMKNLYGDPVIFATQLKDKMKEELGFTNAVGQEAPTSVSRGRNARFCGVFLFYNIAVRQNIWYNNLGEERRFMYATDNYSKNSDFS